MSALDDAVAIVGTALTDAGYTDYDLEPANEDSATVRVTSADGDTRVKCFILASDIS